MTRIVAMLAALVAFALAACGAEPAPSCGVIGRTAPCACPGGAQGAQECGPLGVWGACVCPGADAGTDAGAPDAPPPPVDGPAGPEAGVDAPEVAADAPAPLDGPADAAPDGPLPPTADAQADGGCPEGFAMCVGTTCNNILTSRMWCGSCRTLCGPLSECFGGRCVTRSSGVSCEPGRGDCDGEAANGCETDTFTSREHCGGCGRSCTPSMRCVAGSCALGGG